MTQRIFDMENEQDVKDLFNLFPDDVIRIEKDYSHMKIVFDDKATTSWGLIDIKWGLKTSVPRPVDASKWIGALCWFGDTETTVDMIDILCEVHLDSDMPYFSTTTRWRHCRPVKRDEIKFVEDMED